MDLFSISQLASFAGIKPHTIRMWEKRYNALQPTRSDGNTRYYDNNQLRRLLNIISLQKRNYKLAEICAMSDQELVDALKRSESEEADEYSHYILQLIAAGMSFDELNFDRTLSHCILRFGIRTTYEKIIYKVINRIGLMWAYDEIPPAKEHFISNLIRQKILVATDSLPIPTNQEETWVLFLPENEHHEIGLLFANYFIRKSGRQVIYLGANLPWDSLQLMITTRHTTHLLCFFVRNSLKEELEAYLQNLVDNCPTIHLFVSISPDMAEELTIPPQVTAINSVEHLIVKLQE